MSNIRESETLWHSIPRKQRRQELYAKRQWAVSAKRYLMTQLAGWRKQKWPKEQLALYVLHKNAFFARTTAVVERISEKVCWTSSREHILEGFILTSLLSFAFFLDSQKISSSESWCSPSKKIVWHDKPKSNFNVNLRMISLRWFYEPQTKQSIRRVIELIGFRHSLPPKPEPFSSPTLAFLLALLLGKKHHQKLKNLKSHLEFMGEHRNWNYFGFFVFFFTCQPHT